MIEHSRIRKIHFTGIGGAGMSGIAEVLLNMGFLISGSDLTESDTVKRLKKMGAQVFLGHHSGNVNDVGALVYSSAIKQDNVEVREALRRKIPVIPRAEMLAELMRVKFSIAVAGTHGKTTTTSMIATILNTAKKDPTYVVGGRLKIDESGAKLGKSDYLIAEADESDGSFLRLFPTIAVITNIEDDHIDYYQSMESLIDAFKSFGNKVPFYGSIILNSDCEWSQNVLRGLNKRVLTFGTNSKNRPSVLAKRVSASVFGASFDLVVEGRNMGTVNLKVGGVHNIYNALAAVAASMEIGIDFPLIKEGMSKFSLPERRFQTLFVSKDHLVIDDYAHHPTEVKAIIETLKKGKFKRVIIVFQPHRYTRLALLMDKFVSAFIGADILVVAKIYTANQTEIRGVNSRVLTDKIRKGGFKNAYYFDNFEEILDMLATDIKPGDAIAFLSAGNLTELAHTFAKRLEKIPANSGGRGER
jgi:UDP-N-acetylmuramate--alanine ligase